MPNIGAKRWPRGALPVVAGITLGSLALNILALFVGGDTLAFFQLPTRFAWELGVGAVPALLRPHIRFSTAASGVVALAGAVLVLLDIIHPFAPFEYLPEALPMAIGTTLMILAGSRWSPRSEPCIYVSAAGIYRTHFLLNCIYMALANHRFRRILFGAQTQYPRDACLRTSIYDHLRISIVALH